MFHPLKAITLTDSHGVITDDAEALNTVRKALRKPFVSVNVRRHYIGTDHDQATMLLSWGESNAVTGEKDYYTLCCAIGEVSITLGTLGEYNCLSFPLRSANYDDRVCKGMAKALKPGYVIETGASYGEPFFWIGKPNTTGYWFPTANLDLFSCSVPAWRN